MGCLQTIPLRPPRRLGRLQQFKQTVLIAIHPSDFPVIERHRWNWSPNAMEPVLSTRLYDHFEIRDRIANMNEFDTLL